jgi:hypothetical protein
VDETRMSDNCADGLTAPRVIDAVLGTALL